MVVGVVGPLSTVACAISEAKLSLAVADVVILDEKSRMRNRLMVVVCLLSKETTTTIAPNV